MLIKKGPFGYFVSEKTNETIFKYAYEIMEKNEFGIFLPMYINDMYNETELAYEFSGYITLDDFINGNRKKDKKKLNLRRKAVGNLFYSILRNMDYLVSPNGLVLDSDFIFTNDIGTEIKLCNLPFYSDDYQLYLSTINRQNLDKMLNHSFFNEVLTSDEITSIIYSVTNNDENLLKDITDRISSEEIEIEHKTSFNKSLMISVFSALLSAITFYILGAVTALVFLIISGYYLIMFFIENINLKHKDQNKESISKERKQILFNDNKIANLNSVYLKSVKPINGEIIKYGIYMDKTTIGSDKFLSDLFIDDNSVSSIHAIIELINDCTYISDYSDDNSTYIENIGLLPNNRYELKNGQKITIGELEFLISIT